MQPAGRRPAVSPGMHNARGIHRTDRYSCACHLARQILTEHYARQRMAFQYLVRNRDPRTARSLDDPIRFMSSLFALREVHNPLPAAI